MNTLDLTYCLFYKIWENKEFKNVEIFQNVQNTVFPHIVSAETILFRIWNQKDTTH